MEGPGIELRYVQDVRRLLELDVRLIFSWEFRARYVVVFCVFARGHRSVYASTCEVGRRL